VAKKVPKRVVDSYSSTLFDGLAPIPTKGKYAGKLRFYIFKVLIEWIYQNATTVEGIFRISGELTPVKCLRELFDYEDEIELVDDIDPHVVSGALKLYLRESENPLITRELHHVFLDTINLDEKEAVTKLRQYYLLLPKEHQWILIYLCWLLNQIRAKEDVNKMSLQNLLIVFGPTVMKDPDPLSMDFTMVSNQTKVLALFVSYFNDIFGENSVESVLEQYTLFAKELVIEELILKSDSESETDNKVQETNLVESVEEKKESIGSPKETKANSNDSNEPVPTEGKSSRSKKKDKKMKTSDKKKSKITVKGSKSKRATLEIDEDKNYGKIIKSLIGEPTLENAKKFKEIIENDFDFSNHLLEIENKKLVNLLVNLSNFVKDV